MNSKDKSINTSPDSPINHIHPKKPVVLLAFANDKPDGDSYLRDLRKEQQEINKALAIARRNGLCEIVELPDATTKGIFDIFQNETYRDRIAIFHYGGHGESYKLLLKSEEGKWAPAYRKGLASFLGHQKGLKFIFLNACFSESHASELTSAGVPAVVGTSTGIPDIVARDLSTRFYHGIANGLPLGRAWKEAVAQIKN